MAKLRFCVEAPAAGKVYLAGDFCGWDPEHVRMRRAPKSDQFVKHLELEPGVYQFKYVVDGQWVCDPGMPTVVDDQGTENSVIEVTK